MNFVHSFWSEPLMNRKFSDNFNGLFEVTIFNYALSVEYIHMFGHTITLYTDRLGYELLKPIQYDKIIIVNNDITCNYNFAASIKFVALKNMKLDEILIDGDLFISKEDTYNIIKSCKSDMLCTIFEGPNFINKPGANHEKLFNKIRSFNFQGAYKTPLFNECDGWYNTSLMKFNNQTMKDEYIKLYQKYVNILDTENCFDNIWPDIILEQLHLTILAKENNYSIECVVKSTSQEEADDECKNIGFTHLGSAKAITINSVCEKLKELNEEIYNSCVEQVYYVRAKFSNNSHP